jgi:periplasmic divalent cation tolerance protein
VETHPADFSWMTSPDLRLLVSTFANEASASLVVRQLLEEHLIACGTLLSGAKSLYRWEGKIKESSEVIALMKTNQDTVERCMARLQELHPYEVPEIAMLNPEAVSERYADWVRDALRNPAQRVS